MNTAKDTEYVGSEENLRKYKFFLLVLDNVMRNELGNDIRFRHCLELFCCDNVDLTSQKERKLTNFQ